MSGLTVIEGFEGFNVTAEGTGVFSAADALTRFTYYETIGGFDGIGISIDSGPTGDDFHVVLNFDGLIIESFVPADGSTFEFGVAYDDSFGEGFDYFSDLFDDIVEGGGSGGEGTYFGSSGFSFDSFGSGSYASFSQLSLFIAPSIPGRGDDYTQLV